MDHEQLTATKPWNDIYSQIHSVVNGQEANAWQGVVKNESVKSNSSNSDNEMFIEDHDFEDPIHTNDTYTIQELAPQQNQNQGSKPKVVQQQASHSKTKEALLDEKPTGQQKSLPSDTKSTSTYTGKNTIPLLYTILVL